LGRYRHYRKSADPQARKRRKARTLATLGVPTPGIGPWFTDFVPNPSGALPPI
jgi:hypothetical protein